MLREEFAGVSFPEWTAEFGWLATGARSDRLDGPQTRTVYYEHQGHRIAYTVVSRAPLDVPDHARRVRRDGLEIALYRDPGHGGHDIAIFERNRPDVRARRARHADLDAREAGGLDGRWDRSLVGRLAP